MKPVILIVDDESSTREALNIILHNSYRVISTADGPEALEKLKREIVDLVLLDILMPEMNGLEVLKRMKEMDKNLEIIMLTATKDVHTVVEAMKLGAYDYVSKPFDVDDLLTLIARALEKKNLVRENIYLRSEIQKYQPDNIVGQSPNIQKVFELIKTVAKSDSTIFIYGESGTGKELVSQAIHRQSNRANKPFVALDCAAIPETLLESELFGHEKGAFTGALEQRIGKFELAHEGSIFLDEIGSLQLGMQAKLLRVLEERKVERVGGSKAIPIDVRLISATNVDLKKAIKEGHFREDLYYRLNVIPIFLPPLRERKEDIQLLTNYFLEKYNRKFNKNIKEADKKVLELFQQYSWPGNVRELENLIERLVILEKGVVISTDNLPMELLTNYDEKLFKSLSLKEACGEFERELIKRTLAKTKGNQTQAAKLLGIHRNTLLLKMASLKLKEEPA